MWKTEFVIEPFTWIDLIPNPETGISPAETILDSLGAKGYELVNISVRPEYGLYYTLTREYGEDDDSEGDDPVDDEPTDPEGIKAIEEVEAVMKLPGRIMKKEHANG